MFDRKVAVLAVGAALAVTTAIACGPDFPWQLLDRREATLTAAPANGFAFEAAHLLPAPADGLKAVEPTGWDHDEDKDRDEAERAGLTEEQGGLIAAMRSAPSGDEAFARGEGLPTAVRLYTAGAVAFRTGDLEGATRRFDAILGLPEAERNARAVWAAYMLGRTLAARGDLDGALYAFALTRDLARGGAPDPLGLAVASFGEEARLYLAAADRTAGNDGAAIAVAATLYAEQAARGSDDGVDSLRMVAERLFEDPARLDAAIGQPIVQRLVVGYALARSLSPWVEPPAKQDRRVAALVDSLEKRGVASVAGADRLASLAYLMGQYDTARRAAERASGPLAVWVKAKLALRDGDLGKAAALYAEASRAFPEAGGVLSDPATTLLQGERGTLALARGEYVNALELLHPVGRDYWGDVAHIAERVLTVDELKAFVDRKGEIPAGGSDSWPDSWISERASLRDLLARRLMRDGRYDEAFGYFARPETADQARDYAKALRKARDGWWWIDHARALFEAAVLARRHGMAMMGYEGPPDLHVYDGAYEGGLGQDRLDGPYITDGEKRRFEDSRAKPDKRWHYRYIAVDLATEAADLLPHRSQAFAAVLCRAAKWMDQTREEDRFRALYERYVEDGPYVPWANRFGQDCPEPDFDGAARRLPAYVWLDARTAVRPYRWGIAFAALAVAGAVAALVRHRRRYGRTTT
ncbi:tetratricopeptide repeat protein [Azospirillum sp. sgz302134]